MILDKFLCLDPFAIVIFEYLLVKQIAITEGP